MKKLVFFLSIISLSLQAEAKPSKLIFDYLNTWGEKTLFEESGGFEHSAIFPKYLADEYTMTRTAGEHGDYTTLEYSVKGVDFDIELDSTLFGLSSRNEIPDIYTPTWVNKGATYETFGIAYQWIEGKKEAKALFYQDNLVVSYYKDPEGNIIVEGDDHWIDAVSSTMVVIRLDGIHTRVIGMIDSLALEQEFKENKKDKNGIRHEANAYAQHCLKLHMANATQSKQDQYCSFGIEK